LKRTITTLLLLTFLAVPALASAQTWSKRAPQIGRLYLKQEYWGYIKEAAKKYNLSPCLILAVCAIESRYDMDARAAVLAKFMQRYNGDIHKVLQRYNSSCTASYEREVLRAYQQALSGELDLIREARN
jgi:soluble lytic murein transglycosylase-like protein